VADPAKRPGRLADELEAREDFEAARRWEFGEQLLEAEQWKLHVEAARRGDHLAAAAHLARVQVAKAHQAQAQVEKWLAAETLKKLAASAELERRRKGERALRVSNEASRRQKEQQEDRHRAEVEERLRAGKSYQQIAVAMGWNKTKVANAVARWHRTSPPSQGNRSSQ